MSDAFLNARKQFEMYAGVDSPRLPTNPTYMSSIQVALYRWTQRKVPKHDLPSSTEGVLGAAEEVGELLEATCAAKMLKLAHLELNISQGRRYASKTREELRELKADAIADTVIFLMHLCTAERLDMGELIRGTVAEVLERDWKASQATGKPDQPDPSLLRGVPLAIDLPPVDDDAINSLLIQSHTDARTVENLSMAHQLIKEGKAQMLEVNIEIGPCTRCDGTGKIADSQDGEPWSAWAELPPGSDFAVRSGLVKPIPCPTCGGRPNSHG